jgi:hypothetical protein
LDSARRGDGCECGVCGGRRLGPASVYGRWGVCCWGWWRHLKLGQWLCRHAGAGHPPADWCGWRQRRLWWGKLVCQYCSAEGGRWGWGRNRQLGGFMEEHRPVSGRRRWGNRRLKRRNVRDGWCDLCVWRGKGRGLQHGRPPWGWGKQPSLLPHLPPSRRWRGSRADGCWRCGRSRHRHHRYGRRRRQWGRQWLHWHL